MSFLSDLRKIVGNLISSANEAIIPGPGKATTFFSPIPQAGKNTNLAFRGLQAIAPIQRLAEKPPKFNFRPERIKNPKGKIVTEFAQDIANIPSSSFAAAAKVPRSKNAQELLANVAGAAELPFTIGTFGAGALLKQGGKQLLKQGVKQATRKATEQTLKQTVIKSSITGGKFGGGFGLLEGLQANPDAPNIAQQFIRSAPQVAIGTGAGLTLGAGAPIVGKIATKGFTSIKSLLKNPAVKNALTSEKGFFKLGKAKGPNGRKIHEDDLAEMNDFDNFVKGIYKPKKDKTNFLENIVRIADRYGFDPVKGDKGLATEFNKVLNSSGFTKLANKIRKALRDDKGFIKLGKGKQAGRAQVGKPQAPVGEQLIQPKQGILGTASETAIKGDPIQKLRTAINSVTRNRPAQEKLRTAERGRRTAEAERLGQQFRGVEAFEKQRAALSGELPKKGVKKLDLTQDDVNSFFNTIEDNPQILQFQKATSKTALQKLFNGELPSRSEIALLNQTFPPEITKAMLANRSLGRKLLEIGEEVINIPRAIMSSTDLSAAGRQAIFVLGRQSIRHPIRTAKTFGRSVKQAFSEADFKAVDAEIKARPNYKKMQEHDIGLTDLNARVGVREEALGSNLAEKIPLFGRVIRGSGRAYSGFLNKLRADYFDDFVKIGERLGISNDAKFLADAAKYVRTSTGRGDLPSKLKPASPILNATLFSPKLLFSRLNLLNPRFYAKLDPVVRKEALWDLFTFAAGSTTVLSLAALTGAEVVTDPRNSDFAKIKFGKTRLDILGGFQQPIRTAVQFTTGTAISPISGDITTVNEGFRPLERQEIAQRFFENKTSPLFSFALDLMRGTDPIGEDLGFTRLDPTKNAILKRLVPIVVQDIIEAVQEHGAKGFFVTIPAVLGIGSQTFGAKEGTTFAEFERLSKLSPEEANKQFIKLKKEDSALAGRVRTRVQQKKVDLSAEERAMTNLGVKNGERAKKISSLFDKLGTREEKNALWTKLVKGKIITDEVSKQLKELQGLN